MINLAKLYSPIVVFGVPKQELLFSNQLLCELLCLNPEKFKDCYIVAKMGLLKVTLKD